VQGFGNVGSVAACGLAYKSGMKIVGLSDHMVSLYDPKGFDVAAADRHVAQHKTLKDFPQGERIAPDDFLTLSCDVLVPAAIERVIHAGNAALLRCRVLAEAANGPTTPEADEILERRREEIFIIPDVLCNAGGVVTSYFEWVQDMQSLFWTEIEMTDRLYRILDNAFVATIKRMKDRNISMRTAAMSIGVERVLAAKRDRGLFP